MIRLLSLTNLKLMKSCITLLEKMCNIYVELLGIGEGQGEMSEKPIAEKLLIKPGFTILILNEPDGYRENLKLSDSVTVLTKTRGMVDWIQVFVTSRLELEKWLPGLSMNLKPNGLLWITYPKGTSKIKADINRDSINAYAKTLGLKGVAMISIDEVWSALRLKPAK